MRAPTLPPDIQPPRPRRLRQRREAAGMTVLDVAEETWIDPIRLRELETGAEPTADEALALDECYGVGD